jgi:hypothetical protein
VLRDYLSLAGTNIPFEEKFSLKRNLLLPETKQLVKARRIG